jgi:hypothetical protein
MNFLLKLPFVKYAPLLTFVFFILGKTVKGVNSNLNIVIALLLIPLTIINVGLLIQKWKEKKMGSPQLFLLGAGLTGCVLLFILQFF